MAEPAGMGMMHHGGEDMDMDDMLSCPCHNPANVYPCYWQTPEMMAIGETMQCRVYPEIAETEQLTISGRVHSGV